MNSKLFRYAIGLFLFVFIVSGSGVLASGTVSSGSSDQMKLQAKMINGEVYVKASSLVAELGGSGIYDSRTQTYQYKQNDVPKVIEKVSPSVVAIIGRPTDSNPRMEDRFDLAHGTGLIVSADGSIITNAHVVKDMNNIIVVTSDGKKYAGKRTHIDEESDLALVKINAKALTPAKFGSSQKVKVGETVIAIGTPISFSLRNSATVGVVSGLDRSVNSTYRLLQTDAAINPGNSGGPLVNMNGEIVGINTMKFVEVSVDNMGFSIPADTVQYVLNHFTKYGKVKRPSLGLELEESFDALVGLSSDDPLTVTYVEKNSSAAKAGISSGDLLYSIDKVNVSTIVDLNEHLKKFLPGQKVQLMILSDGDLVNRTVTLGEQKP